MNESPVFRGGVLLRQATQEEVDYVERNYREGDRHEQEVAGAAGERVLLSEFDACWTAFAGGDVLGYFGVMYMPGESHLSRTRALCFMSCTNVDRHRLAFVKSSRDAVRWVVRQCPPWTDRFVTWPLESYAGSVRWQEKVLGMRRTAYVPAGDGERYVVMEITRQEVERW